MTIEKHIEEFTAALKGGRGELDAWLECNNEAECRAAIFGAIAAEREACAKVSESWATDETSTTCANIAEAIRCSNVK